MTETIKNKKMGRPTNAFKGTQLAVRFDAQTLEILDKFCIQENVSRAEGLRRAARNLFVHNFK
jgi:hypothetical protein